MNNGIIWLRVVGNFDAALKKADKAKRALKEMAELAHGLDMPFKIPIPKN